MGIRDGGGPAGVGYACGCQENFDGGSGSGWAPRFCENPRHRSWPCGCKNIGGNLVVCNKHLGYRIIIVGLLALVLLIAFDFLV